MDEVSLRFVRLSSTPLKLQCGALMEYFEGALCEGVN